MNGPHQQCVEVRALIRPHLPCSFSIKEEKALAGTQESWIWPALCEPMALIGNGKALLLLGMMSSCIFVVDSSLGFSAAPSLPREGLVPRGQACSARPLVGSSFSGGSVRSCLVRLRAGTGDKKAEISALEAEAEAVIAEAERLWAEALEARNNAEILCTQAEELAAQTEEKVPFFQNLAGSMRIPKLL